MLGGPLELAHLLADSGDLPVNGRMKTKHVVCDHHDRPDPAEEPHDLGAHGPEGGASVLVDGKPTVKIDAQTLANVVHRAMDLGDSLAGRGGIERAEGLLEFVSRRGQAGGRRHERGLRGAPRGGDRRADREGPDEDEPGESGRMHRASIRRHSTDDPGHSPDFAEDRGVDPLKGASTLFATVMLAVLVFVGPARAADGDAVRLSVSGPGVPYAQVDMEIRARGATAIVRLSRSFGEGFGAQDAVGLSTPDELQALMDALQKDGLFVRPVNGQRPPGGHVPDVRYVLELRREGRVQRIEVERPELLPDRRYSNAIERVRRFVTQIVEPEGARPFVDGRVPKDASGFLHLETSPSGRVYLDGVLLADATPIEALRLPLGTHVLRIVARDGRLERTVDVTIERGKTTSLRMTLE